MRPAVLLLFIIFFTGCNQKDATERARELDNTFRSFDEERLRLFPIEATARGDNRYNDLLTIEFTEGFQDSLRVFYNSYLRKIKSIDTSGLSENDQSSYRIFEYELGMNLEELDLPLNLMPFNQFSGTPLDLGQFGSGEGSQPFITGADYRNWFSRARRFSAWADSAIIYFRKGMVKGMVFPEAVVLKMIPQLQELGRTDEDKNLFFGPLAALKGRQDSAVLGAELKEVIRKNLQPAYNKLAAFLEKEYLPKARKTDGISSLPGGKKLYDYYVRYWTTTKIQPEEIYQKGLSEVRRIRKEMERMKDSLGFTGSLSSFFQSLRKDPQLMPFRSAEEVLNAFSSIQKKVEPHIGRLFGKTPRSGFAIRQTEAFRAASAAAEYQVGTADGSRPGIFYIPILDPRKFNIISGMESLFLHEAIPGHHFQISLQQENDSLPAFRKYAWYGAMGEGWALYCESLGKELGLYSDPYQYLGALGDEIHRAIRLVVDVGLHYKNLSRQAAIAYMMQNEAISLEDATAEVERYMVWPGQALSYKVGEMKIRELRNKYTEQMGSRFSLSLFHDELLRNGVMPLGELEKLLDKWSWKQMK